MNRPARLAPVSGRDRITTIDVLRGFALLGILIANMRYFSHPVSTPFEVTATSPLWYKLAFWLEGVFVNGKFYPLFSFLFGLGFAVQLMRASERGRKVTGTYLRRLLILLGFGVVHGTLIWAGDILTSYALIGLLLLLFSRLSARGLAIAAALVLGLQIAMVAAGGIQVYRVAQAPAAHAEQLARQQANHEQQQTLLKDAETAYRTGSYADTVPVRVKEYTGVLGALGFYGLQVLGMFLLGAWVGRRGILAEPERYRGSFRRFLYAGFGLGLPLAVVYATWTLGVDFAAGVSWQMIVAFGLNILAGLGMVFGFVGAAALLMQSRARRLLEPLADVGRMALTNYLMQSVVCTLIFYGYGLGRMGHWGFGAQVLLTIGLYAFQIGFSNWWLARFRFGPLEWLWRSLTYLRPQPMRHPAPATDQA